MEVFWLERARRQLLQIRDYVAEDNPRAAQQLAHRIHARAESLRRNPEIGRPGRLYGTRELVITRTPFIIAYRVRVGVVEILRAMHGARKWPENL